MPDDEELLELHTQGEPHWQGRWGQITPVESRSSSSLLQAVEHPTELVACADVRLPCQGSLSHHRGMADKLSRWWTLEAIG